jgi:hypothetical protein
MSVAKSYRIYVGARNTPNHSFLPKDEAILRATLGRYFKGWTIQSAEGIWEGKAEETRIITLVDGPSTRTEKAGHTPFESCVNQLKNDLKQLAIMVEVGGTVSFL